MPNGTVTYEKAGEYTLTLSVYKNGSSNETNKTIKVKMPVPTLSVSPTEGDAPLSVVVRVSGAGKPDSWSLNLGNGNIINRVSSDQINGTVIYEQAGEYTLTLTVSANGVSNHCSKNIKVNTPVSISSPKLTVSPEEGTAPLAVQINVSGPQEYDSWNLSLGNGTWINGTNSDQINGTVIYEQAGEYTLTLNVSANGVFSQCSKNVKVNTSASSLSPELTFSLEEGLAPLAIQINVSGTEEYDSWNLSLGNGTWINGTNSDEINRTVTYEQAGEYTLILIAYKNGVAYETSETITVEMPAPMLTVSPEEGTVPLVVQINVSGAGKPDSWNLSLGNGTWINGTSSDEINGTLTYGQVGEYTLKLNVSRNGFSNFSTVEVKALAQSSTHSSSPSMRIVSQGTQTSFQFSDSAIYMIEITSGETTQYFFFTVEDKDLSSGIPVPPEAIAVYGYSEVSQSQVSNTSFTKVTLSFKIQKTWLEENGFASENVVLYRYHNGNWQALDTEVLDEENGYTRFQAQSPGFSLFAIGVKEEASAPQEPISEASTQNPGVITKNTTEEPENPQQNFIWYAIVIAIVIAIGEVYIFKKRGF